MIPRMNMSSRLHSRSVASSHQSGHGRNRTSRSTSSASSWSSPSSQDVSGRLGRGDENDSERHVHDETSTLVSSLSSNSAGWHGSMASRKSSSSNNNNNNNRNNNKSLRSMTLSRRSLRPQLSSNSLLLLMCGLFLTLLQFDSDQQRESSSRIRRVADEQRMLPLDTDNNHPTEQEFPHDGGTQNDANDVRRTLFHQHQQQQQQQQRASYRASFTHENSLIEGRQQESFKPLPSQQGSFHQEVEEQDEPLTPLEQEHILQFHRLLVENHQLSDEERVNIPQEFIANDEDIEQVAEEEDQQNMIMLEEVIINQAQVHDNSIGTNDNGNNTNIRSDNITTYSTLIQTSSRLPHYTLAQSLQQIDTYRTAFAILVYDPTTNQFHILYSRKHIWSSAVSKLTKAMQSLTFLIRLEFGTELEHMRKKGHEFVIPVSSGDYPLVSNVQCVRENLKTNKSCVVTVEDREKHGGLAPVLHFGSVFRRPMFPNMIAMPPPEAHHLPCFEQWAIHKTTCASLRAKSKEDPRGELVYAKEFGIKWKDLKDQIVWRGTDFGYLGFVHPTMERPKQPQFSQTIVRPSIDTGDDDALSRISTTLKNPPTSRMSRKEDALAALKEDFENLVPRWKGVVHTAEAELEVQRHIDERARGINEARRMKEQILPWANIKFSQFIGKEGVKAKTLGSREYRKWERIDFPAVGENMSLEELALYKYHIDLGGGGGTTWSGTIHKLAMPGLLFHHVTPTKDYFHDYMKPWKHYVPVQPNLSDLKEKYDWAQGHQKRAFQIARGGSELMRYLSSPEGMEERFHKDILEPLRAVINAYIPVGQTAEYRGKTWKEVITQSEGEGNMLPVLKCTGDTSASCEKIVGKEAFLDRKMLRRSTNAEGLAPLQGNRQLMPWAHEFFVDINKKPDTTRETALFWHIPKSGGTTIKNLYHCTGQTLAHRGGVDPKFGYDHKDELVVFKPQEDRHGKFVNVDTTIKEGILRAKEMGLVQSHVSDIIFTMEPTFAGQNLYDKKNKGRILALFRHPVDRMVSKFYYLQVADWERGYRPDWANLSLMEWIAKAELKDDNLIVRKLVEKSFSEPIDETDLMRAKAILRRRIVVGLMNQMEESVHRFNIVLGIDESSDKNRQCMDEYFSKSKENDGGIKNANKHPKVVENSPEWKLLAEKEWLDMRLYAYAEQLFEEQKETIYSYTQPITYRDF